MVVSVNALKERITSIVFSIYKGEPFSMSDKIVDSILLAVMQELLDAFYKGWITEEPSNLQIISIDTVNGGFALKHGFIYLDEWIDSVWVGHLKEV
jgi:hypothetical protein